MTLKSQTSAFPVRSSSASGGATAQEGALRRASMRSTLSLGKWPQTVQYCRANSNGGVAAATCCFAFRVMDVVFEMRPTRT